MPEGISMERTLNLLCQAAVMFVFYCFATKLCLYRDIVYRVICQKMANVYCIISKSKYNMLSVLWTKPSYILNRAKVCQQVGNTQKETLETK